MRHLTGSLLAAGFVLVGSSLSQAQDTVRLGGASALSSVDGGSDVSFFNVRGGGGHGGGGHGGGGFHGGGFGGFHGGGFGGGYRGGYYGFYRPYGFGYGFGYRRPYYGFGYGLGYGLGYGYNVGYGLGYGGYGYGGYGLGGYGYGNSGYGYGVGYGNSGYGCSNYSYGQPFVNSGASYNNFAVGSLAGTLTNVPYPNRNSEQLPAPRSVAPMPMPPANNGTFPYDGGPRDPIPQPAPLDYFSPARQLRNMVPIDGRLVSMPTGTTMGSSDFVSYEAPSPAPTALPGRIAYPAYGEDPVTAAPRKR